MNIISSSSGASVVNGDTELHLSPRERQVAELIACGFSHKKVASRLGISTTTVSVYVHKIASRLEGEGSPSAKVMVWYLDHVEA